jgi:hypothetical protein
MLPLSCRQRACQRQARWRYNFRICVDMAVRASTCQPAGIGLSNVIVSTVTRAAPPVKNKVRRSRQSVPGLKTVCLSCHTSLEIQLEMRENRDKRDSYVCFLPPSLFRLPCLSFSGWAANTRTVYRGKEEEPKGPHGTKWPSSRRGSETGATADYRPVTLKRPFSAAC